MFSRIFVKQICEGLGLVIADVKTLFVGPPPQFRHVISHAKFLSVDDCELFFLLPIFPDFCNTDM